MNECVEKYCVEKKSSHVLRDCCDGVHQQPEFCIQPNFSFLGFVGVLFFVLFFVFLPFFAGVLSLSLSH
jgi:hypothetical protein